MSKNNLLLNSFISLIIVFFCLFIFINNLKDEIRADSLFQYIFNGWTHLILASILLMLNGISRLLLYSDNFTLNNLNCCSLSGIIT